MPSNAPAIKVAAVEGYGATRVSCEPTNAARSAAAELLVAERGASFVHPSNDPMVMAGQGTMGLEMLEQVRALVGGDDGDKEPPVDAVFVPVGGGGMLSGVVTAVRSLYPSVRVIAAEPSGADDCARSKREGRICDHETPPSTIADGLRTVLGSNNWPIIRDLVEDVVVVGETDIVAGMRLVWERMKQVIEPSSAVGVAALFTDHFARLRAVPGQRPIRRAAVVLCRGNADLDKLPW
jgi:threonine dehydratase